MKIKICKKYLKIRLIFHAEFRFRLMVSVFCVAYLQAAAAIRQLKLFVQELTC